MKTLILTILLIITISCKKKEIKVEEPPVITLKDSTYVNIKTKQLCNNIYYDTPGTIKVYESYPNAMIGTYTTQVLKDGSIGLKTLKLDYKYNKYYYVTLTGNLNCNSIVINKTVVDSFLNKQNDTTNFTITLK